MGSHRFLQVPQVSVADPSPISARAPIPSHSVDGGQADPRLPRAASVRLVKSDPRHTGQAHEDAPEPRRDRAQDAGLAMRIVAVKHRQAGIQRQIELLDGAVVLDLHTFQFHDRRLAAFGPIGRDRIGIAHDATATHARPMRGRFGMSGCATGIAGSGDFLSLFHVRPPSGRSSRPRSPATMP